MKITEGDVCRAYEKLVQTMASRTRGLEHDDALSIAKMGLLRAVRTWCLGMGDFEAYAILRIKRELDNAKRSLNRQVRVESRLSLDAQLSAEQGSMTYSNMLAITQEDQTNIDIFLFFKTLSSLEQRFVYLRMQGYDNGEIPQRLHIEFGSIGKLRRRVRQKATRFFGKPR